MGRTTTITLGRGEDAAIEILTEIWGAQTMMEVIRRALQIAAEKETGMSWGLIFRKYLEAKAEAEEEDQRL